MSFIKDTIEIVRINQGFHYEAQNEQGNVVHMDASPSIGGENLGFRPMQMLLAGIGGCSAIDVTEILKKQKQVLKTLEVSVSGERPEGQVPAVFEKIHLHFKLSGELQEEKVQRALELSIQKYCSVGKMLEKTAQITYDYEIILA